MKELLLKAKKTASAFGTTPYTLRVSLLQSIAESLEKNAQDILAENRKDLDKLDKENPLYDRLLLTENRILSLSSSVREIATQKDVLGAVLEERTLKSGVKLKKVQVPLGVVACIYEARPNVTIDMAVLSLFTGNVCILRGSSHAEFSNKILVRLIQEALMSLSLPADAVQLFSSAREDLPILLQAKNEVDVLIPRGGAGLIALVREQSKIPVIETGAGVCHTYIDEGANIEMAVKIIVNAKVSRPSVCNSLDTLIVHKNTPTSFYERLEKELLKCGVTIWADESSLHKFSSAKAITKESEFETEFLSLQMNVKQVQDVHEAIEHIGIYGSKHSECIVSENHHSVAEFFSLVDASSVYHNASTRFTDGGEFGLGAEVGISTQKLHARGPFGTEALTTYKYLLEGEGQTR